MDIWTSEPPPGPPGPPPGPPGPPPGPLLKGFQWVLEAKPSPPPFIRTPFGGQLDIPECRAAECSEQTVFGTMFRANTGVLSSCARSS